METAYLRELVHTVSTSKKGCYTFRQAFITVSSGLRSDPVYPSPGRYQSDFRERRINRRVKLIKLQSAVHVTRILVEAAAALACRGVPAAES